MLGDKFSFWVVTETDSPSPCSGEVLGLLSILAPPSSSLNSMVPSSHMLFIGITVTCLAEDIVESSLDLFKYTLVAVVDVGALDEESNAVDGTDFDSVTLDLPVDADVVLDTDVTLLGITTT